VLRPGSASVESLLMTREASPLTPRSPQQQGSIGHPKDDQAR